MLAKAPILIRQVTMIKIMMTEMMMMMLMMMEMMMMMKGMIMMMEMMIIMMMMMEMMTLIKMEMMFRMIIMMMLMMMMEILGVGVVTFNSVGRILSPESVSCAARYVTAPRLKCHIACEPCEPATIQARVK